jgi:hypothetical protein
MTKKISWFSRNFKAFGGDLNNMPLKWFMGLKSHQIDNEPISGLL